MTEEVKTNYIENSDSAVEQQIRQLESRKNKLDAKGPHNSAISKKVSRKIRQLKNSITN